jgi:epoxide hydrolase
MSIRPFTIAVPQSILGDVRERLVIPGQNYGGPELAIMKRLPQKALRFDWRKKEAELNKLPHFTTEIDGQTIHFSLLQ